MENRSSQDLKQDEILKRLTGLESRISILENQLQQNAKPLIEAKPTSAVNEDPYNETVDLVLPVDKAALESNVVEYGFAWLGSLVLLFGIAFLMIFTNHSVNGYVSTTIGILATVGVYYLSDYLKTSHTHLSFMLLVTSHLLIFYSMMSLSFFTSHPLVSFKIITVILMCTSIGVLVYNAIKQKSQFMALLSVLLLVGSGIISDSTHITLSLGILTSALAMYLFNRLGWSKILIVTIILVYFSHLLWLLGNPFMGHPMGAVGNHQYNLIYLFVYGAIFSYSSLIKQKGLFSDDIYMTTLILNGIIFTIVTFLVMLSFYQDNYIYIFLSIFVACMTYSLFLKSKIERKFDASFYVNFAFMALSVAIYGFAKLPGSFIWLTLQSLLVLSMALWYRSQIIVMMNTLLFCTILLAYLISTQPINSFNFTFAIIAFTSARIINWRKERLTLKTDLIRNTYLIVVFFMVLYSLNHAVPQNWVAISWTASAILYFILSWILQNTKYRWMAIATLLVTCIHVFMTDFSNMGTGFRVIAFLFLAIISLGVSLFYTKRLKKKNKTEDKSESEAQNIS